MTSYVNPFTGQTISPSSVSYEELTISVDTELEWPINGNVNTPASSIIDVEATTTGLKLLLPSAEQVSTGQSVLIRNIGANPFTVADNDGGTIVSVSSGIAEFIFLTDNTSNAGVWASVVFGAGTSSANASALAGYGLTPIGLTLNQAYNVTNVYSSATLSSTSRAQFLVWSSGVGTLTLPSASVIGNNWFTIIKNNGSGILTLTPQGTDTIDGNASQQLQLTESLVIVSNGSTGFNTYAYGRSNQFAFTQLAVTTTGGTTTLTSAQGANIIQEYFGALTSNATIVMPSTVQLYSLLNNTTGSYSLTFRTAAVGGATVTVAQGQTAFVVCDGTNVYSTTTSAASSFTSITLAAGSTSTPSINFTGNTNTGIYLPASNQVGISINGTQAAVFSSTGLYVANGISGGIF